LLAAAAADYRVVVVGQEDSVQVQALQLVLVLNTQLRLELVVRGLHLLHQMVEAEEIQPLALLHLMVVAVAVLLMLALAELKALVLAAVLVVAQLLELEAVLQEVLEILHLPHHRKATMVVRALRHLHTVVVVAVDQVPLVHQEQLQHLEMAAQEQHQLFQDLL
jgi:hypothetical protein